MQEAKKFDKGKARHDLIPPEALDGLAKMYGMGAIKYGERNWEAGLAYSRIFAALIRHAWAHFRGENYDQKDGQHHMLSAAWNALALYTYDIRIERADMCSTIDDRPKCVQDPGDWWNNKKTLAESAETVKPDDEPVGAPTWARCSTQ